MPQYILRDLPPQLWTTVKQRAERDGWPLRALILRLLEDYASGRITPIAHPPVPHPSPMWRLVPDSAIESWLETHLREFTAMREEAQHLISSQAKYLDPDLALGKTNGVHLYLRFAEQLRLLAQNGVISDRLLPSPDFWLVRRSDPLTRDDLQRLSKDADQVLSGLRARAHQEFGT